VNRTRTSRDRGPFVAAIALAGTLAGCSAEIGSDAWCRDMDKKPKDDWSANEAADSAKHCVLRMKPEG
jgi:hypothetical protein